MHIEVYVYFLLFYKAFVVMYLHKNYTEKKMGVMVL